MESLIAIDTWLFLKLNAGVANPVFDVIMPIVTNIKYWRLPILIYLVGLATLGGGKGRSVVLIGLITITITDQLSSHLLKDWIGRIRPCHVVDGARVIVGCGNSKAFPSSHAVNTMAAAILFGLTYRRWLGVLLFLSIVVSYSRIYIGVHYPADMLGGWILGGGIAYGMLWLQRHVLQQQMSKLRIFRPRGKEPAASGSRCR